jgi:hypothetical protein
VVAPGTTIVTPPIPPVVTAPGPLAKSETPA